MLYGELTAIFNSMDMLTSYCMLLSIGAASSLSDDFSMCILGYSFGGCIGSVVVD